MKTSVIFSSEEVRSVLAGGKTQFRIPCEITINGNQHVDPKYAIDVHFPEKNVDGLCADFYGDHEPYVNNQNLTDRQLFYVGVSQQPFNVGDVIYVRETVGYGYYAAWDKKTFYKADYHESDNTDFVARWVPAAAMPKEEARLFLRVNGIGVQRVQDISYEGCKKEGISIDDGTHILNNDDLTELEAYRKCFSKRWDKSLSIKKKTEYGWEQNPWVWVVSFERG